MRTLSAKHCTVIGTFLILLTGGFVQSWANVSTYLYSYLFFVTKSASVGVQTPLIISLIITLKILVLTVAGRLSSLVGKRFTTLIGIVLFCAAYGLSYFTIHISFFALTATLALLLGTGLGVLEGVALKYVIEWSEGDIGIMTSRLLAAYSTGGVFINQFATLYANPHNLTPNVTLSNVAFFTQPEVLENVPKVLLWLAVLSLALQLLGFCILKEPCKGKRLANSEDEDVSKLTLRREYGTCVNDSAFYKDCDRDDDDDDDYDNDDDKGDATRLEDKLVHNENMLKESRRIDKSPGTSSTILRVIYERNNSDDQLIPVQTSSYREHPNNQPCAPEDQETKNTDRISISEFEQGTARVSTSKSKKTTTPGNKSPNNNEKKTCPCEIIKSDSSSDTNHLSKDDRKSFLQDLAIILRSRSLYVLWLGYFFIDSINISLGNFQKIYGQLYIHDDYFFSTMATVMAFLSIVTRVTGGFILDRVHYKTLLVALLSVSAILHFVMYFSAMVNKWFYFASTVTVGCTMSIATQTWMVATVKIFGNENANTSMGLMMTSAVAIYLLSAPIFEALLMLNWFSVFLWPSSMAALGLAVTVLFLEHTEED